MQFNAFDIRFCRYLTKTLLIMKLTAILILAACLNVCASGYSQEVTLLFRNSPMKKVFKEIKRQTGYNFLYTAELINQFDKVDVEVKNVPLDVALQQCLQKTQLSYTIIEKTIVIKRKEDVKKEFPVTGAQSFLIVRGKITDENGNALQGVNVLIKGTSKGVSTDVNGDFQIDVPDNSSKILIVSYVGMEEQELSVIGKTEINISLHTLSKKQQEVVVVGYGTQKKVNLTGSVSTVSGTELDNRPITQASQALAGLVTGVTLAQGSGRPGNDGSTIQIRELG